MWGAGLFPQELAPDVGHSVLLQGHGRISALLRAVMHKAVFADVEITGAGAASPLVWTPQRDIVLERIDASEAALLQRFHGVVYGALFVIERLQLAVAIMNDANGRAEAKFERALADRQRILGILDSPAHDRVDVHMKIGMLG